MIPIGALLPKSFIYITITNCKNGNIYHTNTHTLCTLVNCLFALNSCRMSAFLIRLLFHFRYNISQFDDEKFSHAIKMDFYWVKNEMIISFIERARYEHILNRLEWIGMDCNCEKLILMRIYLIVSNKKKKQAHLYCFGVVDHRYWLLATWK